MGKICTFCKYNESKDKCRLIVSNVSVEHTERCTYYEPVKNVAPVIHAHWVEEHRNYMVCSNCGKYRGDWRTESFVYCPHCGAKMDEEVNNA